MPDFLRGSLPASSAPTRNWDGWYAGGQVGYSSATTDFSQTVVGQTNYIFRNSVLQEPTSQWALLSKASTQGTGFGGFVGRNYQWDDVVLGVEANYNYIGNLAMTTSGSIGPLSIINPAGDNPPPGVTDIYRVQLDGAATAQIRDAITFRGRAGWATGDFLPYIFGGLAVGRIDVARTVTSQASLQQATTSTNPVTGATTTTYGPINPLPQVSQTQTQGRSNNYAVGWTAGIGMEYMLWGNVFVRGEWEYIRFMSVENTAVTVNSARAGIGYKF